MRSRSSLLVVLGCVAGLACGKSKPTQATKDPPVVVVSLPATDVIGTSLKLDVGVNGCSTVDSVTILSDGTAIKDVTFTSNPMEVDLTKDDLTFKTLAGHFTLSASATCKDGRTSISQAVSATFLPVAAVYANADGSQIVPTYFSAEGSGSSVSFVGCVSDGSATYLARYSTSGGAALAISQALPVTCLNSTWFSDRYVNGVRWMMTPPSTGVPGVGALAFDSNLKVTGWAVDGSGQPLPVSLIGVGPDGDAVVVADDGTNDFFRIAHDNCKSSPCAPPTWTTALTQGYLPQANPVVLTGNEIEIPTRSFDITNGKADYYSERWVYGTTSTQTGGGFVGRNHLAYVQVPQFQSPVNLAISYSSDGSLAYLPFVTNSSQSALYAYRTTLDDTTTWQANNLAGDVFAAVPFGPGDSYIAAIGEPNTYFVKDGSPVGDPVSLDGTLVPMAYVTGKGASGQPDQSFFLFTGPTSGTYAGLPEQVFAFDSPANGLLFEFDIPSGSLSAAVDDSGQVWMRVGASLYQLLPLSTYRAMLGG